MSFISNAFDRLIRIIFYIGVISGIVMAALILVSSLLRYIVGSPISFSDELAGLLFVTLAFTTFPLVMDRSEHIQLSIVTEKLSHGAQRICRIFASLILFAFAIVFIYQSWAFMDFSRMISSRTDVSGILLWPWMALMPISMVLCVLVELRAIFRILKDSPVSEHSV
ncbi:TRAP transporter small permease [Marinomonas sp. CT5]|uniref:TRAP transporter small permease n=1 Tax=Marinomonas sp. CT5 TaxID=2066133 RepID=UPI001BB0D574|nr:TRAP transporter small permease [Marinomonas sp. CT5]